MYKQKQHSFYNSTTKRMAARLIALAMMFLPACLGSHAQSRMTAEGAFESPEREVRAVWLTTLSGLDWPSSPARSLEGAERQKRELRQILDKLQAAGINTVLFQTRIRSTTAYASAIEPWDGVFSGTPGKAPAYDPLEFAIEECHKRGMELHAWVVAFPVGKVATMKRLGRKALPARHPEMCRKCGDQWMLDPGVPSTAAYLAGICAEITRGYNIDGIHLDYIRYPEHSIPFNDRATYRKYGRGKSLRQWRKDNVTRCVEAIRDSVKTIRPWVKMSCSPIGKYSDLSRYSSRGWNALEAVSQDAQAWLKDGLMDMLFPMMYFTGDNFYPFAIDWKEQSAGKPIVPGLGIYFLHENEKDWDLGIIEREMNFARYAGLGGVAFFRSKFFTDNVKGIYDFTKAFNSAPALPPALTWLDSIAPASPKAVAKVSGRSIKLSWNRVGDQTPLTYNIYRLNGIETRLVASGITDTACTITPALPSLLHSRYAVTAMDAYGNESRPAFAEAYAKRPCCQNGFSPKAVADSISVPQNEAEYLLITDMEGRHIKTVRGGCQRISVEGLASGFYILRTLDRKGRSSLLDRFWKQ